MKAVRWFGPRDMRLVDMEKPVPKPHEALVRVESVGVCGSDMHYYLDGRIGSQVVEPPLILGHEYAGMVEAVGDTVDPALVGQRVAVEPGIPCLQCEWCKRGLYNVCRHMFFPGGPGSDGALCEYMTVHSDFCFPVPEGMDAPTAAMIEPVAVAVHTVELARIMPGETVAIFGLGPVGLLTARMAQLAGAQSILGADLQTYRVEAGQRFGVDHAMKTTSAPEAIDALVARMLEETDGRGVDVAIDCCNRPEGLSLACRTARPAGRCVLVGISGEEVDPLPVSIARRHELNLQWCRRFKHNFPTALALVASGRMDVKALVTHSFPLEESHAAFELVADLKDNVLKASIDF